MSDIALLLSEITSTYVRLKASPIAGVGVFAIRDIPKGCRDMFSKDNGEWIKVPKHEVESLPEYAREMIYNYCTFDHDFYYIDKNGFKRMDISSFINHSEKPNLKPVNNGEFFEATSDIKVGEELFLDYADVADE